MLLIWTHYVSFLMRMAACLTLFILAIVRT